MKIRRRTERLMPETIISLIDVVFFLLVFFMLVGRMDATTPFEVLPPVAAGGSNMPAGGTVLAIGADGVVALNGEQMDEADLLARLGATDTPVRINADRQTELRHVLPLIARLEAAGTAAIELVVTPPK